MIAASTVENRCHVARAPRRSPAAGPGVAAGSVERVVADPAASDRDAPREMTARRGDWRAAFGGNGPRVVFEQPKADWGGKLSPWAGRAVSPAYTVQVLNR
jgi:hypothetical protein